MNIDRIRKLRGLLIKQERLDKNLTQDALAKLSGVDRKTIMSMESGENGWNVDSEILIMEAIKNYNETKGEKA